MIKWGNSHKTLHSANKFKSSPKAFFILLNAREAVFSFWCFPTDVQKLGLMNTTVFIKKTFLYNVTARTSSN